MTFQHLHNLNQKFMEVLLLQHTLELKEITANIER